LKTEAPTPSFVVECYWPDAAEEDVRLALARIGRPSSDTTLRDPIRSLGCIMVPSDGLALFMFRAPSEASVRLVGELAEVPFDRVVESINVGLPR
jgi:hypothetical protein